MNRYKCRHVRKGTLHAATTVHHVAIKGATRADELDELTELCSICSAVLAAYLQFVEADDVAGAKEALLRLLRGMSN
jgi:hypothetical protein